MKQTITYRRRSGEGTLTLSGTVDIFEAQALQAAALKALGDDKAETLRLNLAEVDRLDISAIQILCALQRDLGIQNRSLVPGTVPGAVAAACAGIGCKL